MRWVLRIDVVEGKGECILINLPAGNFAAQNLRKNILVIIGLGCVNSHRSTPLFLKLFRRYPKCPLACQALPAHRRSSGPYRTEAQPGDTSGPPLRSSLPCCRRTLRKSRSTQLPRHASGQFWHARGTEDSRHRQVPVQGNAAPREGFTRGACFLHLTL